MAIKEKKKEHWVKYNKSIRFIRSDDAALLVLYAHVVLCMTGVLSVKNREAPWDAQD